MNIASFITPKNNGNFGWLAGIWKKSLESNSIYLTRASACLTSGDMQYVDEKDCNNTRFMQKLM